MELSLPIVAVALFIIYLFLWQRDSFTPAPMPTTKKPYFWYPMSPYVNQNAAKAWIRAIVFNRAKKIKSIRIYRYGKNGRVVTLRAWSKKNGKKVATITVLRPDAKTAHENVKRWRNAAIRAGIPTTVEDDYASRIALGSTTKIMPTSTAAALAATTAAATTAALGVASSAPPMTSMLDLTESLF